MATFSEPAVYLVSRPAVDWSQVAEFLDHEGVPPIPESIRSGSDESSAVVEIAARLCYMSFGRGRKDIKDFINNLLISKDGSVLEHVNYGFVITGVSRSLTHELVRHRAGFAYSQRSQRYIDESNGTFVPPLAVARSGGTGRDAVGIFEKAVEFASQSYDTLVKALEEELPEKMFESVRDRRKAIRQAARSVLPNAAETKIFVTGNVRAWRHFIEMRGAETADWEIRALALKILGILETEAPLLFGDFKIDELPDGTKTAKPAHSKV